MSTGGNTKTNEGDKKMAVIGAASIISVGIVVAASFICRVSKAIVRRIKEW